MTILETPAKVYSSVIRVDADNMVHIYAAGEYFVTHVSCDLKAVVAAKGHLLDAQLLDDLNNTWDFVHKVEGKMSQEEAFENRQEIIILDDQVMFIDKLDGFEDGYCLCTQDSLDVNAFAGECVPFNGKEIAQEIEETINNWHINQKLNIKL